MTTSPGTAVADAAGTSAQARAVAAAMAVARVLPSAVPLAAVAPQAGDATVTSAFAAAATAAVNGTVTGGSGLVVVLVGRELVDALAGSPLGGLDLAAAVQPALDAAAQAVGGTAAQATTTDLELVVGDLGGSFTVVPLVGNGTDAALLITDSLLVEAVSEAPAAVVTAIIPPPAVAPRPVTHETAPVTQVEPASPHGQHPPLLPVTHAPGAMGAVPRRGIEMLHGVDLEVSVELGRTRMLVRDLLALAPGAVLELDRAAGSPADLLVNGRLIARGEVVVVDEDFGLRITQILDESLGG